MRNSWNVKWNEKTSYAQHIVCDLVGRHYSRLWILQNWGGNTLGQYSNSNSIIIYVEVYMNIPCILTDISVTRLKQYTKCTNYFTSIDSVIGRERHTSTPSITHVPRWHPQWRCGILVMLLVVFNGGSRPLLRLVGFNCGPYCVSTVRYQLR